MQKFFYLHAKSQLHISCLSWDNAMKLESCCFGYFMHAWLWPSKTMVSALRKLWCLSSYKIHTKKQTYPSTLLYEDIANLLLQLLETCLANHSKTIVSTCRKFWCLFTCKKSTSSLTMFFLRYCIFKNSAIWLTESILAQNLINRFLSDKGSAVKYKWLYDVLF